MTEKTKKKLYLSFGGISLIAGIADWATSFNIYDKSTGTGFILAGIILIYLSRFHKNGGNGAQ